MKKLSKSRRIEIALNEAIAAIYFNDNSDYLGALWNIVRFLNPEAAELLEKDEWAAFDKYCS